MARRSDEIVAAIRDRRRRLGEELHTLFSLDHVRERVRNEPAAWILGGALAGALSTRFVLPVLLGAAGGWVRTKLRDTLVNLVVGAVRDGALRQELFGAAGEPEDASGPVPEVGPNGGELADREPVRGGTAGSP